jgi:hypothetical protein
MVLPFHCSVFLETILKDGLLVSNSLVKGIKENRIETCTQNLASNNSHKACKVEREREREMMRERIKNCINQCENEIIHMIYSTWLN